MNRIVILKSLAAAALALGTLAATTTAHARDDVQFSITLGTPGFQAQSAPSYGYPRHHYVQPAPVYVQPTPIYAYPQHGYVQPRTVYVQPRPIYAQPAPAYGWGHQRQDHHGRRGNARGPNGDYDRDGTPNRYDRFPRNPNWR